MKRIQRRRRVFPQQRPKRRARKAVSGMTMMEYRLLRQCDRERYFLFRTLVLLINPSLAKFLPKGKL